MQERDAARRGGAADRPELGAATRIALSRGRESGALEPIRTRAHEVEDAGMRFSVRVAEALRSRPPAAGARNPFLPYDENLFVCDLPPAHVCLLNKYPVLPDHLLLVTRAYEEQESPLGIGDFEALWTVLLDRDRLAFYNAGAAAGASQPHRHLQVVPLPLSAAGSRAPIDPLIEDARFDTAVGRVERLPFHHAVARLRDLAHLPASLAAEALHRLYQEMARAFGCDRAGRPYNLLVTRDWMLFVPRSREHWESVSLNGLAFAGAILVRDERELDRVRAVGPMSVLAHVGVRVRPTPDSRRR